MLGSGNFWNKSPSRFLKILKLRLFYSWNFKIFKNALGQFIPNRPPKHVITSTNQSNHTCLFQSIIVGFSEAEKGCHTCMALIYSHINHINPSK